MFISNIFVAKFVAKEVAYLAISKEDLTKTPSSGLDPKLGGLLAYLFGFVSGLVLFLIEKDNKYIRFHAMQSILLNVAVIVIFIALTIVSTVLTSLPGLGFLVAIIGLLLSGVASLVVLLLFLFMMYKGYTDYDKGEAFKLPVIGNIAEQQA